MLLDLLYLINSLIVMPVVLILRVILCKKVEFNNLSSFIDNSYSVLFDMTKMEVEGFRRMRTITQLSFESVPQIALQTRILHYYTYGPGKTD